MPPPRPGRSWLIVAAAALMIGAVFAFRGPAQVAPHATDAAASMPPPANAQSVLPAPQPIAEPVAMPAPIEPADSAVAPVVAPHDATAPKSTTLPHTFEPSGGGTRLVSARVAPSPPAATPSAAHDTPEAAAPIAEPSARPSTGRSVEIERLIEERR